MAQVNTQLILDRALEFKNEALKYDELAKQTLAKLKSIPLWRRILQYSKQEPLRQLIKEYEWQRFKYTAMMMACHRDVKRLRKKGL